MYLSKLIRLFRIKEPFLSQQEMDQEQEALVQAQKKINFAMEVFKSVLELLLGYRLLPNLYAITFFLLSLSSLSSIVLIHLKTKINPLIRVLHSLLFSALYLYKFQTSDFLFIYLIYVSSAIELDAMKVFYYLGFQVIYETLKPENFVLNNGEQIFSWLILCTIYLNLFVTNKKKLSLTFPQFSIAKDAESYRDANNYLISMKSSSSLFQMQFFIDIQQKVRNHEVLYVNKPFLKKFGAQTNILRKLEQFILQTDHEYNNEGNKSTDHYFTKSTNILESLNHQDLFLQAPFIAQAQLDDQTYKINMQQCTWKGQQSYAITIINITDDQLVMELKKLDSYKDNILATVSHDLKNPIGAIYQTLLFVQDDLQKLIQQQQDLQQSVQFIDICINNIIFLQSFVKDLSDFQMIKMQKLKVFITEFDILNLCQQIQQAFQLQLQIKQIEFHIKNKAEDTLIKNDEVRLKQVLFNLISNSSKFTSNGHISLNITDNNQDIQEFYVNVKNQMKQNKSKQSLCQLDEQLNNLILITVSDTGVGISDEVKGQLFKSYSTFDGEKKQNRNGVGLGLMISKQLCGYIGPLKYIYINSRIGVGTNFQFVIYRVHQDDVDNLDDQPIQIHQVRYQKIPKQTPQNKQRSVLLVDDELFNNATNKQLFQQCGVNQIQIAYSASEAIQMVKQKQFDMILLDVNLPDKSGIQCIRDFKKFNKNAKIYILSAFDDQETRQQCIKEGADRLFQKPLTQKQILNIL
ncbi:unnamed protein product (macronuclear) [Paramecium tetraurelia]|uniref:histidine kinase n=1 Tax=Paramecium tetraurelia TaxID=5888 RepID=A0BJ11_PARTE|nr:uncharacterized protein GSPATT00004901001 [Paramecium tetraurelia]CAK58528.1 unnamed protein product [Paramecium tetraurelia]|eukprot:XP_001425926.1 hypothetical protein (macronuclear) [Paramecium tetraurelia strain d4-2]